MLHQTWDTSDLESVMDRMGHAHITTTQKYRHTFSDADTKNLNALGRNAARLRDPIRS